MDLSVNRVALIGKTDAQRIEDILPKLYRYLIAKGKQVVVEPECARFIPGSPVALTMPEMSRAVDLAIVIGGDGTLLGAARELAAEGVALVGVNMGRLGFLVDISPSDVIAHLEEIFLGRFRSEQRRLLRSKVMRNGAVIREQTAVNDVVIHSWNATSMIEIVTHIDGAFLNSQRSDGLIVSTPTGSTAYALSGGGPILYPTLNAIVLVPINPHTLTNRPIVVSNESTVEITFRPSKQFQAKLACDNIPIPDIDINDTIAITTDPQPFCMLHPENYDFFQILRAKLNWGSGYPTESC
jgi:NAD+ kinase